MMSPDMNENGPIPDPSGSLQGVDDSINHVEANGKKGMKKPRKRQQVCDQSTRDCIELLNGDIMSRPAVRSAIGGN